MAFELIPGFAGTTTITGTGNYTGIADVTTPNVFKSLADMADGKQFIVHVRTALNFETVGVTKTGGATPVLQRTSILDRDDGTTNPMNWGAGEKLIISGMHGPFVMTKNADNAMAAHIAMLGYRLGLSPDNETYLYSSANDRADFVVNNALAAYLAATGAGEMAWNVYWANGGTGAGPAMVLARDDGSPATGHLGPYITFLSKNGAGEYVPYANISTAIGSATDGNEFGELHLKPMGAGALVNAMILTGNYAKIFPGVTNAAVAGLVGKTAQGIANTGIELVTTGQIAATTTSLPPFVCNRKSTDGQIFQVQIDGSFVGDLTVSSGTFSLTGAVLAHPSEWADGGPDPDDMAGMVVCSVEAALDDGTGKHPLCRISDAPGDPAVYGVLQSRMDESLAGAEVETRIRHLTVAGTGAGVVRAVGPVLAGDLLETSDIPGVARAQSGFVMRSSTLGKARESIPEPGEVRLIRATLMAG